MKKNKAKLLSPTGQFLSWIPKADAKLYLKGKLVEVVDNFPYTVQARETIERIGNTLLIRECRNHREELYYLITAGRYNKPRRAMVDDYDREDGYVPMPLRKAS